MNRYEKGQIYKIVGVGYNKCYIGSTTEKFSLRMARHRSSYKLYLDGKKKKSCITKSFELFDEYGTENCKIIWLEDYPCNSRKELEAREGYYIKNTECVNRYIAGRTQEQWVKDNKELRNSYQKKYYDKNKTICQDRTNKYKANNQEHIKEYRKEYFKRYKEKHCDEIKNKKKEYYEAKKNEINTKRREKYRQKKEQNDYSSTSSSS